MTDNTAQNKVVRPPIVVVLGHVDHGKTTLLDTIRKTNVAAKETGGITQHIGAYQAQVKGKTITFLDTPGHEAFSAIRSRGAKVADVAILVVAADEGIKPQTKEAIQIIQREKIPFIVAMNKIDKEGANVQKVKQDLAAENVLVEDWGGTVPSIEVAAKSGKGVDELLDMILLVSELEELNEDLSLPAEGVIIESNLDKQRGYVATALVQKGILSLGDWIVAGTISGKIKSMEDFKGQILQSARPSQPVVITGWSRAPEIGRPFKAAYTKDESLRLAADNTDLNPLFQFFKGFIARNSGGESKKTLNIIIKTDVASSLEAIDSSLQHIKSEEVSYDVITHDIGNIGEADVKTAIATKSQIVGFRVAIDGGAKKLAEKENIKISSFDIIYELIEYVRRELGAMLEPEINKVSLGKVRILATFKKDSKWQVVGGRVTNGKLVRGAFADVTRAGKSIGIGKVGQVQHDKKDAPEVNEGMEAGMRIDIDSRTTFDIRVGDILEIYQEEHIQRSL